MGYGSRKIVDALYKIKPPFNVNKIAQVCAIESLKDQSFIKKSVKHNLDWAKKIQNILNLYNIKTNDIGPNFFLLDFKSCKLTASFVERNLEKSGIILREMNSYGIKNCLRLTIGNMKENIFLIKQMKKIFKNV